MAKDPSPPNEPRPDSDADADAPPAPVPAGGARSAMRAVLHRALLMAVEELQQESTQKVVRERVVDPLIKMVHAQLTPYLTLVVGTVAALLIMSTATLLLAAMFYFRSRAVVT